MSGLIKRWCLVFLLVSVSAVSAQQSTYVPRVHPNDPRRLVDERINVVPDGVHARA